MIIQSLKNYFQVKSDPLLFLAEIVKKHGDFAKIRIFTFRYLLINDPELIRKALVENPELLIIKGGASAGLTRLIGHGILTNRGENWRQSRDSLLPLFQQASLENYYSTVVLRTQESLNRWQTQFANKTFSLNREVLALSCRIMCSTLFNYTPSFVEAEKFADAIWVLQLDGMNRYLAGSDFTPWLPTTQNRKVNNAKKTLYQLTRKTIEHGAEQPLDEIMSLLFAGTESPANTVCWALKLLSEHPEWLDKLKSASGFDTLPTEGIDNFDILTQIICETLRMYPAGWAFERYAVADVALGEQLIKKGTRLLFSPYLLHRNLRFWSEPEKFNPLRFTKTPRAADGVPSFAYLPFGAGPRSCIGSRYAFSEIRIILKMILQHMQFSFQNSESELVAKGSFKIRFNKPLMVTVANHKSP